MTVILNAEQHWICVNCDATAITRGQPNRFHQCAGLKGLTAPMLLEGMKAKVEVVEREDYVGDELVQRDMEGRPVMAVVTTRDEGQDCIVLAPTAIGGISG